MSTLHPHSTICVTKSSLSLSFRSTSPKVDLIHDDWFGLAPLASPESMSELSSIGSRASLVNSTSVVVEKRDEDFLQSRDEEVVVAGDFNVKSPDWEMERYCPRARAVTQMVVKLNLTVFNVDTTTTFRRSGYRRTIIDVTLASSNLATRIDEWKVLENFNSSDH
nr:unnamed protein product [Callosobruchus analis]